MSEDYTYTTEPTRAQLAARVAELERENAELRARLDAVRTFATERREPLTDEREPINLWTPVKHELYTWLMAQAPSGEGYSEFIAKALAWRKYMQAVQP